MNFEHFLNDQERIYDRFRDTVLLEKEGIAPNVPTHRIGYIISFRHPKSITDKLAKVSRRAATIIPAIAYDGSTAHTTIATLDISEQFEPDPRPLDDLCSVVKTSFSGTKASIMYTEWLMNQNTEIAAGTPDISWFQNMNDINETAIRRGLNLKLPWGAHITANRFLEKKGPLEARELLQFYRKCEPLGTSTPEYIDVGYFLLTKEGFTHHTTERFVFV